MNFISHYYISSSPYPEQRIGNLLPDIFKKFSYYRNKHRKEIKTDLFSSDSILFWAGIENHYRVDGLFHNMDSFHEMNHRILDAMKISPALNSIQRKFIVAHVLYELILDHMLISKDVEIVDNIYQDYYSIQDTQLKIFLEELNLDKEISSRFIHYYHQFSEPKFLYYYQERLRIIRALYYVTGEIGKWTFDEEKVKEFDRIIVDMINQIDIDAIFDYLKPTS